MPTDAERERLFALTAIEREERTKGTRIIAGVDEAGRGPLAGPVVAAACIIPPRIFIPGVDDSKKLTPLQRREVFERIIKHPRITYAIGIVEVDVIDSINIFQATVQAMLKAINALAEKPELLLVDGMRLPHPEIPCRKVIGGDALSQSIAAASVIAKETRDDLMRGYHVQWPHYGFDQHKGYGTELHRAALEAHGPCSIHRRSFEPVKSMVLVAPV
ncbi:MAG: ribonuclease HII [Chlamydiales bacterium]|nr:ribonuclease HII [Chlamydiales bacterium]